MDEHTAGVVTGLPFDAVLFGLVVPGALQTKLFEQIL
jgi:hypothetical protein